MADHANYPRSVCKHHAPESDLDYGTIGSVVIDVTERALWACSGNPCRGEWREVRLCAIASRRRRGGSLTAGTADWYAEILEAWCSGLTCSPVKAEIAGSNPVASAGAFFSV